MKVRLRAIALTALLLSGSGAFLPAQEALKKASPDKSAGSQSSIPTQQKSSSQPPPTPAAPAASSKDVDSVDHIIAALYDVISGPKGKARDWERMHSLFFSGAHLIPTGKRASGEIGTRVFTVDEYAERSKPFFEQDGFYESEVARRSESFADITQVWSTYVSRHSPGEAPFARGINGIRLVNDGKRWWILNIFWEAERDDNKLPEKYLQSERK